MGDFLGWVLSGHSFDSFSKLLSHTLSQWGKRRGSSSYTLTDLVAGGVTVWRKVVSIRWPDWKIHFLSFCKLLWQSQFWRKLNQSTESLAELPKGSGKARGNLVIMSLFSGRSHSSGKQGLWVKESHKWFFYFQGTLDPFPCRWVLLEALMFSLPLTLLSNFLHYLIKNKK